MQQYVKDYFIGMGYEIEYMTTLDIPDCELNCGVQISDVHHIDRRGMGGTKKKYVTEQMMGICRQHHMELGDKSQYRAYLYWIHFINMENRNIKIDFSKLPKDLFFDQYTDEQKITSCYYSILHNNGYIEAITTEWIDNSEKITILITNLKGKKITEQSGYNKFEIQKSIMQFLS